MRAILALALLAVAAAWVPARVLAVERPAEPTESEVRAEYDRVRVNWHARHAGKQEYDVRHIQLESREEAAAVLQRIARGERFEDLARALSRDAVTAAKGGSFGWILPPENAEPFVAAMADLRPAGLTRQPVRTEFGWHVIEVLGVREPLVPPFEELQELVRKVFRSGSVGEWTLYDRSGIYAREVDTRSLVTRGDRVFFRYRERTVSGTNAPQTTAWPIRGVVDCAREERADLAPDGSFELRPVFPNTVQARQTDFVCRLAFLGAREATPAAGAGLSCDSPAAPVPRGFTRENGFGGATVTVRGQVTVPGAAAAGEVIVETPSGHPLLDEAAVKAFKAMQCSARDGRRGPRWVRQSYVFAPEAAQR